METITFDKLGEPLSVKFKESDQILSGGYCIHLYEKNSIKPVASYDGVCHNPIRHFLPVPVTVNDGRKLGCMIEFIGIQQTINVSIEVYQGDTLLKTLTKSAKSNGNEQHLLLIAKLKQQ